MNDVQEMFERQARWQKARKDLSWAEKVRMVERVREATRQWRAKASHSTRHPSNPHVADSQEPPCATPGTNSAE